MCIRDSTHTGLIRNTRAEVLVGAAIDKAAGIAASALRPEGNDFSMAGSGAMYIVRDPLSATGSCSCPWHLQMGICKHRVRVLQHLYPSVAANEGGLLRRYLGQLFGSTRGGYAALRAVVVAGTGQVAATRAAWPAARRPPSAVSVPPPIKADAKARLVQGMAAAASHFTAQASGATTARQVAALEPVSYTHLTLPTNREV